VIDAVVPDGVQTCIAQHNFQSIPRSRIALPGCLNVIF
jgi:hypothetical protein